MTLCLAIIKSVETVPTGWTESKPESIGGSISCSCLAVGGKRSQRATRKPEESKRTTSVALIESQKKVRCQKASELE